MRRLDIVFFRSVEGLAMLLMASFTSVCFYQVVARFLINVPATWSEPLTRALMIWSIYLGAAGLVRRGLLISVNFLHEMSRGRVRKVFDALHFLAACVVFSTACFYGFKLAWRVRHQILAGVNIPISYAYLAIPVGSALCLVASAAHYIELLNSPHAPSEME